jgi:hypothetical protein
MNTTCDTAKVRPTTVAFVNCFDATIFGRTLHMTAREERRLRNVLAALNDYGFILRAILEPALPGYGFADVIDHLRTTIGAPLADTALAAAERSVPAAEPAPAALMPVWAFEPDGGSEDVMLGSGEERGTRFHPELYQRALANGYVVGQEGDAPRGRFVYFRNEGHPGTIIELSHATPTQRRIFDAVREAAVGWDGRDPVRMGWPM